MADTIFTGMSRKELFYKTFLLVGLPLLVLYLVFFGPIHQSTCLLCVESAASPTITSLTLFGPSNPANFNSPTVGRRVSSPAALARFVQLSLRLRRYQPDATDLKLSSLHYRLHVNKTLDTCQVNLFRTRSGRETVTTYEGDYYECPRLVAFADSLFTHTAGHN